MKIGSAEEIGQPRLPSVVIEASQPVPLDGLGIAGWVAIRSVLSPYRPPSPLILRAGLPVSVGQGNNHADRVQYSGLVFRSHDDAGYLTHDDPAFLVFPPSQDRNSSHVVIGEGGNGLVVSAVLLPEPIAFDEAAFAAAIHRHGAR